MDAKIIKSVIILIILISLQYTLNLILRELIEIKDILIGRYKDL
ncbi:MAG TPA: hypothetical protein VK087_02835 [Tissierellaceae bacterium]|nr:hypothetical protein [Tissierellaceae bacterium]